MNETDIDLDFWEKMLARKLTEYKKTFCPKILRYCKIDCLQGYMRVVPSKEKPEEVFWCCWEYHSRPIVMIKYNKKLEKLGRTK